MDGGRDKAREDEHGPLEFSNSPAQRDGDSAEIAEEELSSPGRDLWRRGLVLDLPEENILRRNVSLTSSPIAKRVNFSPMSSPRIGQRGASLPPSSSSSPRNKPSSLKNLIPKLSFKNRSCNNNNVDVEKAEDLAFASSPSSGNGRYRPAWTLTNILTPRLKKTESLPVTPIAHSNPESMHGRYVVDPVTSMVSNF